VSTDSSQCFSTPSACPTSRIRSTLSCGITKSALYESRLSSRHAITPRLSPTKFSASTMAYVIYPSVSLVVRSQPKATGCLTGVLDLSALPSAGISAGHLPLSSAPASSETAYLRTIQALPDSPSTQRSFVRALAKQRAGELMPVPLTTVLYRATLPLLQPCQSLAQNPSNCQSLNAFVLDLHVLVSIPPLTLEALSIAMMKALQSSPTLSTHAAPFLTHLRCHPRLASPLQSTGLR
jgi:hypothetical protein